MATHSHFDDAASVGPIQHSAVHQKLSVGSRLESIGLELARYGLAVIILWIGFMKFTAYEAEGISPLAANSPLMSWAHSLAGARGFSAILGVVEMAVAILIALRRPWPRASAVGSALAVGMFLTTLSFLITTPGVWEPSAGGFPALSAMPGQFLIKDLALLGISVWMLGESVKAAGSNH